MFFRGHGYRGGRDHDPCANIWPHCLRQCIPDLPRSPALVNTHWTPRPPLGQSVPRHRASIARRSCHPDDFTNTGIRPVPLASNTAGVRFVAGCAVLQFDIVNQVWFVMEKVQLFEAKARLSELVDRAEAGREVIITRRGRAVARIVPARQGGGRREVDRDAIVDEIEAFARTVKVKGRFNLRKLIEDGRK